MKKLFIIVLMLITSLVPNKYDGDVNENELQNTNDEEIILSLENEIVQNEVIEQVEENHIVAQDTSKIIVQEEISIENNNSEKEEIVYQEDTQSYQEQPKIEKTLDIFHLWKYNIFHKWNILYGGRNVKARNIRIIKLWRYDWI